jgi:hypothetical protein
MNSERWQQVRELFHHALERDEAERARYLDETCSQDEDLGREVASMLAFSQDADDFIEVPATGREQDSSPSVSSSSKNAFRCMN